MHKEGIHRRMVRLERAARLLVTSMCHAGYVLLGVFTSLNIALASEVGAHKTKEANDPAPTKRPQIAIVIDDLGYTLESGRLLSQLPYPLTLAIIPDTPHADEIAAMALDAKQELILHVPMQPKGLAKWEHGLNTEQSHTELSERLIAMLNRYPEVRGINNHGGSLLTADLERMNWVMAVLKPRQLYFLDSRTTSDSRAILAADAHSVDSLSRDIFLDNVREHEELEQAFDRLRGIALKHGRAIAIGHPHKITIEQLLFQLPKLVEEGFELTYCSELLPNPSLAGEAKDTQNNNLGANNEFIADSFVILE